MKGRIWSGVLLLFAVGGLIACEQTKKPCRKTEDCRELGYCAEGERVDECVADSDEDCRRATICIVHGKCKARDGHCVQR